MPHTAGAIEVFFREWRVPKLAPVISLSAAHRTARRLTRAHAHAHALAASRP